MKKIIIISLLLLVSLISFSQSNTYFHDRIDTTIFAVADTVGHGANHYYATNTSADFNIKKYNNGCAINLFIKKGCTGSATFTLITKTGTLTTKTIKKENGQNLASGDIKDSTSILLTFYGSYWRLNNYAGSTGGAAGGELGGTYPNPTFSTTPTGTGAVVKANNPTLNTFTATAGTFTATVSTASLTVTGGTLGAGKVFTDVAGTGLGSWQYAFPTILTGTVLPTVASGTATIATSKYQMSVQTKKGFDVTGDTLLVHISGTFVISASAASALTLNFNLGTASSKFASYVFTYSEYIGTATNSTNGSLISLAVNGANTYNFVQNTGADGVYSYNLFFFMIYSPT